MEHLRAFLSEQAIPNPEQLTPDGRLQKFNWHGARKDGWFIGFVNNYLHKPGQYICAVIGSFKTGDRLTYIPHGLSTHDKSFVKTQIEEAQKKLEAEKAIQQQDAAEKAVKFLDRAKIDDTHPYLIKKGLKSSYGAKVLLGTLYIPMQDIDGKIVGAQRIFPNGDKRFIKGQITKGAFHIIGSLDDPEIFICEGFATGASIHEATHKTVVIAFSAHSLKEIAILLRRRDVNTQLIICGDNDRGKIDQATGEPLNIGRVTAEKAALASQAAMVIPRFEGNEGKDFNDLHMLAGLDEVRRQLLEAPPREDGYIPLGYDESTHFFYHLRCADIVRISAFSKSDLFKLAPLDYWEANFPGKNESVNWTKATNDLIQQSRAVGNFDTRKVRGTGVWLDDGRTVVNTGRRLVVDRKETGLGSLRTSYHYVKTVHQLQLHPEPLMASECSPLIDALSNLSWRYSLSSQLLAGWLAIARVAGALPIRPHIWLTGGSGTGKSTVMENIIAPALGIPNGRLYLQGSSTEAGLRQTMKCSSLPVIFDEFETVDEVSKLRLSALVELMRNSWSASQGSIIKGSSGGHSVEYQLAFSCLVSSIRVWLTNDADRSRFSILELMPHQGKAEQWRIIKRALLKIDDEFGERLFARSAYMLPAILQNYRLLQAAIGLRTSQRTGQQIGTLLAGYCSLVFDEPITTAQAESIADDVLVMGDVSEESSDQYECLRTLLTTRVEVTQGLGRVRSTIEAILLGKDDIKKTELHDYGIKVDREGAVLIDQSHVEIKRIFAQTRWQTSWSHSLLRIDGASKASGIRFSPDRGSQRCIRIPRTSLEV